MRKFRFSLAKVLQLRANRVEQERGLFRIELLEAGRLERMIAEFRSEKHEAQALLRRERARPVLAPARLLLLESGLEQLEGEITLAQEKLKIARIRVEHARERLRVAKQEQEMLEKLKERHLKRYRAAVRAEEMKAVNEIAVIRFAQRTRETEELMMGDRENA